VVVSNLDVLQTDPVSGKRTPLGASAKRALGALVRAEIPFAVIGASALAARGLPRFTADLDVVVTVEDAFAALDALATAGFSSASPIDPESEPEAMYVTTDARGVDVDVLVAAGEPESTVIAEATRASVFGARAPVATLEHLVLMYLYSNQVRHAGDLARIVTETDVDLVWVERYLADVHPEMLEVFAERVRTAKSPPPAPPRPTRRRSPR
jgi:hypothetical protein